MVRSFHAIILFDNPEQGHAVGRPLELVLRRRLDGPHCAARDSRQIHVDGDIADLENLIDIEHALCMRERTVAVRQARDFSITVVDVLQQTLDANVLLIEAVLQMLDQRIELVDLGGLFLVLANLVEQQFKQVDTTQVPQVPLGTEALRHRRLCFLFSAKQRHILQVPHDGSAHLNCWYPSARYHYCGNLDNRFSYTVIVAISSSIVSALSAETMTNYLYK